MSYIDSTNTAVELGRTIELNEVDYPEPSTMTAAEIKETVRKIVGRKTFGLPYLFTPQTVKLDKSNKLKQELNIVMHLAPSNLSGYQTCAGASPGCRSSCLNTSGKGRLTGCQVGRIKKTKLFFEHRELFAELMRIELNYWMRRADKLGMGLAARPNGTSDIKWEKVFPWMFNEFNQIQFYDYTKLTNRFGGSLPENYFLVFSRSEEKRNQTACDRLMTQGVNVAVVFKDFKKALTEGYKGLRVINGEKSDRRYADPRGVIVGLPALGEAKKDSTGFVVEN
jgi:hypothetical protein